MSKWILKVKGVKVFNKLMEMMKHMAKSNLGDLEVRKLFSASGITWLCAGGLPNFQSMDQNWGMMSGYGWEKTRKTVYFNIF